MSIIKKVTVYDFTFEVQNMGGTSKNTHNHVAYVPGGKLPLSKYAIVIETEDGLRGEYVTHWGGTRPALAQTLMLASDLPGKDSDKREEFFNEWNRRLCHHDHMGQGAVDIALWDLAGKEANKSISQMLGVYRDKIPAYASSFHGDNNGGLDSPEAFAEFAQQCYDMGYRAFKHHGWFDGDAKLEAKTILTIADKVGDKMDLMYDAASDLKTFADALYVGKACDEANLRWYEDPYRDISFSAFAHQKLRSMIKTPILLTEHVRGLAPKADFVLAGGTDILRADPEYDMGITGAMKIAHMAEALGLDVEVHACGPAHRHVIGSIRNTNYYEVACVGPKSLNLIPPVYACDYTDQIDCIDENGMVTVPQGPGLGVVYDWDWVEKHATQKWEFVKK